MELRDYLRILRRDRLMIALVTVLAVGLSLAFTYTLGPSTKYEATTRLFVSASAWKDRDIAGIGDYSVQRVQSYVDLVSGDEISRRVVQRLGLRETPRDLAESIAVSADPGTVILRISVYNSSAGRAQLLANAVAKEFIVFVRELETPPGETRSNFKATVFDTAAKPTRPVEGPRPLHDAVVGLVLGFLAGFGLAVLRESIRSDAGEADFGASSA